MQRAGGLGLGVLHEVTIKVQVGSGRGAGGAWPDGVGLPHGSGLEAWFSHGGVSGGLSMLWQLASHKNRERWKLQSLCHLISDVACPSSSHGAPSTATRRGDVSHSPGSFAL